MHALRTWRLGRGQASHHIPASRQAVRMTQSNIPYQSGVPNPNGTCTWVSPNDEMKALRASPSATSGMLKPGTLRQPEKAIIDSLHRSQPASLHASTVAYSAVEDASIHTQSQSLRQYGSHLSFMHSITAPIFRRIDRPRRLTPSQHPPFSRGRPRRFGDRWLIPVPVCRVAIASRARASASNRWRNLALHFHRVYVPW